MFLIVEGTDEQRAELLKDYPWLIPTDSEQLPVKASALLNAQKTKKAVRSGAPARQPNYELFKFEKVNSHDTPSKNWTRVPRKELPTNEYLGMFMCRMLPTVARSWPKEDGAIHGGATRQFTWLKEAQAVMQLLTGNTPDVFGIRLYQARDPKVPAEFKAYHEQLQQHLDAWFDPATIGNYPVHGSELLLRFGFPGHIAVDSDSPYGFGRSTGLYKGLYHMFQFDGDSKLPLMLSDNMATLDKIDASGNRHGRLDDEAAPHKVHMLDSVRSPSSWQYIKKNCNAASQLRQFGEVVATFLGEPTSKRETELHMWQTAFHAFLEATFRVDPGDVHADAVKPSPERIKQLTQHFAPLQAALRKTWEHYTCFRLFEDVPVEGKEFINMMKYVHIVDAK